MEADEQDVNEDQLPPNENIPEIPADQPNVNDNQPPPNENLQEIPPADQPDVISKKL